MTRVDRSLGEAGEYIEVTGRVHAIRPDPYIPAYRPEERRFLYKVRLADGRGACLMTSKRSIDVGDVVRARGKILRYNYRFDETDITFIRSISVQKEDGGGFVYASKSS